ncbi:uncharacterized protein LOC109822407 [Asparagus officinalis]|uniref:uncharacterized protein LOC109822407 n=1 Tax=Asparagus officinalis TaxID=4686 RepID=UPI00098DE2F9|nr:uncharacterized protein LOC109822407 [Asparagus officinalis]
MTRKVASNGSYGNGVHNDLEATISRDDRSVKQFKPGDIAWIKTRNCWWPGQVVHEGSVSSRPKKRVKNGVLVRMYGCYEYLYVDPVKNNTEFENMLKQENLSRREAFQKSVDKELSRLRSGMYKRKASESRDTATVDDKKTNKRKQDKMQGMEKGDSSSKTMTGAPGDDALNLSERRTRVMQSLGLLAPSGSPYRRNGFALQSPLK